MKSMNLERHVFQFHDFTTLQLEETMETSKVRLLSASQIMNNAKERLFAFESYDPGTSAEPEEE